MKFEYGDDIVKYVKNSEYFRFSSYIQKALNKNDGSKCTSTLDGKVYLRKTGYDTWLRPRLLDAEEGVRMV